MYGEVKWLTLEKLTQSLTKGIGENKTKLKALVSIVSNINPTAKREKPHGVKHLSRTVLHKVVAFTRTN